MNILKATATRIRKTKNEAINYGDVEVLKAALIGKYNYLALVFVGESTTPYIGASATRENASKWTPGQMSVDVYLPRKTDSEEEKAASKARYQECKAKYGVGRRMSKHGCVWYRFDRKWSRVVLKIERS